MKELKIRSSVDSSLQPSRVYIPGIGRSVPLLVVLHTWSYDYSHEWLSRVLVPLAKRKKWALLLPDFRGSNLISNPSLKQACGSEIARQDIIDAVAYVAKHYAAFIDKKNIYIAGGSGGGHMALLTASCKPELWRGVFAWCPVTDLELWHNQNEAYRKHIEAACGGPPTASTRKQYRLRSPLYAIDKLQHSQIYIAHGKWDAVVPPVHSIKFYEQIARRHPQARTFLEIFDGDHDVDFEAIAARIETLVQVRRSRMVLRG